VPITLPYEFDTTREGTLVVKIMLGLEFIVAVGDSLLFSLLAQLDSRPSTFFDGRRAAVLYSSVRQEPNRLDRHHHCK
jgi:hypothetical protein